ncbi:hypothetical protein T310_5724 [Rasamsonia emersonii CBS 393.64]|uniref:Uncharacterized protein n=1 Tax=Rasamsonia emersonii (strain ATCC 16479 / CBS 393.64 / IMI 116815) TaxID=1408163 RepID=A0A0F4YQZ6_RASE3|nr:hypothetical protein T310_5724 [Rasamsonia emersonii CBS 393.64]KKA20261.1 hypothetical protein T310_5724 [Rasamsonia emersonii CBS 393.64]
MRFSIALVSLSLSALALAGSSNYLNLFDNPSCAGEPYGEYGIYHSDECHTGQPELNRVQSVNTVLIENGCYTQLYWHWRHGQLARPEYLHQCEFAKRQCVILAVFYAQELPVERVKRDSFFVFPQDPLSMDSYDPVKGLFARD